MGLFQRTVSGPASETEGAVPPQRPPGLSSLQERPPADLSLLGKNPGKAAAC